MLEIGRGLTGTEEQTHLGMWCMMSSPLLIGCDLTKIPEPSLRLLKNRELIAINQDTLGLQARVVQHEGEGYVLAKDLVESRGTTRAVALYNPSDEPCEFNVPLQLLEMQGLVQLRDVLSNKDLKAKGNCITATVAPHGVTIYRISCKKRLVPETYEAEWAYLPLYDALGKRRQSVNHKVAAEASGGVVVENLGGSRENTAIWRDVYAENGGNYTLTVTYQPAAHRGIEIWVNGTFLPTQKIAEEGGLTQMQLTIPLKQGYNTIELGNRYSWAPDIDNITLKQIK